MIFFSSSHSSSLSIGMFTSFRIFASFTVYSHGKISLFWIFPFPTSPPQNNWIYSLIPSNLANTYNQIAQLEVDTRPFILDFNLILLDLLLEQTIRLICGLQLLLEVLLLAQDDRGIWHFCRSVVDHAGDLGVVQADGFLWNLLCHNRRYYICSIEKQQNRK